MSRFKKYRDVISLVVRHGGRTLLTQPAHRSPPELESNTGRPSDVGDAVALARELEALGPTFIKMGQLLSTRSDLLPKAYLEALARLQDGVEPFSFIDAKRIVTAELGKPISKLFTRFEHEPVAAASLSQVHRARIRGGVDVAVKIQRPNIREQLTDDVAVIATLAGILEKYTETGRRYEVVRTLEEFRATLLAELDFMQEAHNMRVLVSHLREFDRIVVPEPVDTHTATRVLTMEYVEGTRVIEAVGDKRVDGPALADQLFSAYFQQILVDGFFHADPHPGNLVITDDGRLALLDIGMVGRVASSMQEDLLKLMLAAAEGEAKDAADLAIELSEPRDDFNEGTFRRQMTDLVMRYRDASLKQIPVGRMVMDITAVAVDNGLRMVPELTLVAKTLLNLDEVIVTLDPDFDPSRALQQNASRIIQQRLAQGFSPAHVFPSLLEAKHFVEALPSRANRILENVARNQLRFKVEMIDEGAVIDGLQKVANRITVGLVLAALILGAALLMRVETSFRIFGYPGIAILFFMSAAGGGLWLMFTILSSDRASRAQPRLKNR